MCYKLNIIKLIKKMESQSQQQQIADLVRQSFEKQNKDHHILAISLCIKLLTCYGHILTTSQIQKIVNLGIKCSFKQYGKNYEQILKEGKTHSRKNDDNEQKEATSLKDYQQIYDLGAAINGISEIRGLSSEELFEGYEGQQYKEHYHKFVDPYYENTFESAYKNITDNRQQDQEPSLQNLTEQRQILLKACKFRKLHSLLAQKISGHNLLAVVQKLLINHQYLNRSIKRLEKFENSKVCHNYQQLKLTIQKLQKEQKKNIKHIVKRQQKYLRMLKNEKKEDQMIVLIDLLEKLYLIVLKIVRDDWDLILRVRIRLKQLRDLHQVLQSEQQSQIKKEKQNKFVLKRLNKTKGEHIDTILSFVEPQQALEDKHNLQLKFKIQQSTKSNEIIESFKRFVQLTQQILNFQINEIESIILNATPFISLPFDSIFKFNELQSFAFMNQFQLLDKKLSELESTIDQLSQEQLLQQLNYLLDKFSRLYSQDKFEEQQKNMIQKFCHKINERIEHYKKNSKVCSQAALTIFVIWIKRKCGDLNSLEDLFLRLKKEEEEKNSLCWFNVSEKISFIFAQQLSRIKGQQTKSQEIFQYCIDLIQSENGQTVKQEKYKESVMYLKVRKQKHFSKVHRQMDFKQIQAHDKKQKTEIKPTNCFSEFFIKGKVNIANSLLSIVLLADFWVKQKQTKIADYKLSIALLRVRQRNYKAIQEAEKIVLSALSVWQKYQNYNFNSISRIKLIRYWLGRNCSINAYKQLRKIKYYHSQDISFYSERLEGQKEQNKVQYFQTLLRQIERLFQRQYSQEQVQQYTHQILSRSKEENLTYDSITVIFQAIALKKTKRKKKEDEMIKQKLIKINQYHLEPSHILYDQQFHECNPQLHCKAYKYSQLYKGNKIVVYESDYSKVEDYKNIKKIIENIWTISHQNLCTIQLIQNIEDKQNQFRVYITLQNLKIGNQQANFQKLVREIVQTIFFLGKRIPDNIICNQKSLHLLSLNQFQINPMECFSINKQMRSRSNIIKSQQKLLSKARKSYFKHLKRFNHSNEDKVMMSDNTLNLFNQYAADHIENKKIEFHKDIEAALYHPLFWSSLQISKFIDQFESQLQYVSQKDFGAYRKQFNKDGKSIIGGDWGDGLDQQIVNDIVEKQSLKAKGQLRGYKWDKRHYKQISYLVNCIRNSIHHFIENDGFGKFQNVEQMVSYFINKYPKLLAFLWQKYDSLHYKFKKNFPIK